MTNALMILAVLLAPFFAVFGQREVEKWKERRERKLWVFKALMATRGATLSHQHVQALNMIELEFAKDSDEPVRRAWREYHDHLNSFPQDAESHPERAALWSERTDELLGAMLGVMGKALGYDFDPLSIRKGAYAPKGHADAELEQQSLRRLLLASLLGQRSIPVSVVPQDAEAEQVGEKFREALLAALSGDQPILVQLKRGPSAADQGEHPSIP